MRDSGSIRVCIGLVLGVGCGTPGAISSTGGSDAGAAPPPPSVLGALCPPDPDCFAGGPCTLECPDYWVCETIGASAMKRCTNPGPDLPDDGLWSCYETGRTVTCRGSSFPADGGGGSWNCVQAGDLVECVQTNPDLPDEPSVGWNCYFSGGSRVCDETPGGALPDDPGTGVTPPGGGSDAGTPFPDGPGTGGPDAGTGTGPDVPDDGGEYGCECIPSTTRFCHVNDFDSCIWGQQVCEPDGSWGACTNAPESVIPADCRNNTVTLTDPAGNPIEVFVGYDAGCCVRHGFCCDNEDFDHTPFDPTQPLHASIGNCTNVCAP